MTELQSIIETAFENRASIASGNAEPRVREAVNEVLAQLDAGKLQSRGEDRRRVGDAPMDQEGGAAVLPHRGQRRHPRRLYQLLR